MYKTKESLIFKNIKINEKGLVEIDMAGLPDSQLKIFKDNKVYSVGYEPNWDVSKLEKQNSFRLRFKKFIAKLIQKPVNKLFSGISWLAFEVNEELAFSGELKEREQKLRDDMTLYLESVYKVAIEFDTIESIKARLNKKDFQYKDDLSFSLYKHKDGFFHREPESKLNGK